VGFTSSQLEKFLKVAPKSLLQGSALEKRLHPMMGWMTSPPEHGGLALTKAEACSLLCRAPGVLCYRLENVTSTSDWLRHYLDLNDEELKRIILTRPLLLGRNEYSHLLRTARFFTDTLGMSHFEMRKTLLTNPTLLTQGQVSSLEPRVAFLQTCLKLEISDVRRMILAAPRLMTLSVESNLQPKILWMSAYFGLDAAGLRKLIAERRPSLLLYNCQRLVRKIAQLQEVLDCSEDWAKAAALAQPSLLTMDVENNIRPKVRFLQEEFGASLEDIRRSPVILLYSLSNRLAPRVALLKTWGIKPNFYCHCTAVALYTEAQWTRWLRREFPQAFPQAA
jgi:hypothetical protein